METQDFQGNDFRWVVRALRVPTTVFLSRLNNENRFLSLSTGNSGTRSDSRTTVNQCIQPQHIDNVMPEPL